MVDCLCLLGEQHRSSRYHGTDEEPDTYSRGGCCERGQAGPSLEPWFAGSMRVGEMIAGPQRVETAIFEATPSADEVGPRFVRQNQCAESWLRSIGYVASSFGRDVVGRHRAAWLSWLVVQIGGQVAQS